MGELKRLRRFSAFLTWAGLGTALGAGLAAMAAGPGYRWGWWGLRPGFQILRYAAWVGLGVVLAGFIGVVLNGLTRQRTRVFVALLSMLIGGVVVYIPWHWLQVARRVPPIHDITTDTEDPPAFDAILSLRAEAPNPASYGGPEIARQQKAAYPDIRPLDLDLPPDRAFTRALAVCRDLGWDVVVADRSAGRIEASDTTFWFGFVDDIVIRIRPRNGGSRVDVRSVSRVGRSDVGTNARRIRRFLARLRSD